jgi:hypothetical protein
MIPKPWSFVIFPAFASFFWQIAASLFESKHAREENPDWILLFTLQPAELIALLIWDCRNQPNSFDNNHYTR